tara:strand:- start:675 stop:1544 length:870 start_codon:yes stop_codon:yes gene_type:complete
LAKNDFINFFKNLTQNLNNININEILENLKNIKVEDLKNVNYKRLIFDIRRSKYTNPSLGFLSASLLFVFVLLPTFELLINSLKKAEQYKNESRDLLNKKAELRKENTKFEEIKTTMEVINSSFIKNEQVIFISKLLNEASKKSNIQITYFSPILNAKSSKLCKNSLIQKNSKKFKSKTNKSSRGFKGSLQSNYYEVKFNSDYLDIIQFLKDIQMYDVTIIPYCLEVESQLEILKVNSDKKIDNDAFVIPLNKSGSPIDNNFEIEEINNYSNLGKVFTRIVFKIPSDTR